jgi:hypothetical protein
VFPKNFYTSQRLSLISLKHNLAENFARKIFTEFDFVQEFTFNRQRLKRNFSRFFVSQGVQMREEK